MLCARRAHKRAERMQHLTASQARGLQETVWADMIAWNEQTTKEEQRAKQDAARLFSAQRALMASPEVCAALRRTPRKAHSAVHMMM